MTRRIVWIALAAAAFVILSGSWFLAHFERVRVEKWSPPAKEAQRNPYLALERFMAAMGRPLARAENAVFLDRLPAGGVLILDNHRRAHLSPARLKRLLAWVEAGGYLIVAAEPFAVNDPVLAFFQVNCGCGAEPATPALPQTRKAAPRSINVSIPGAARPLAVDFNYAGLTPGKIAPVWRSGAPDYRDQLLHFRHGAGQVTVLSGLAWLFANRQIGHQDHAELLWTLLETYQPDRSRPVTLVTHLSVPSLWEWLADSAWTAVVSAAVLVALWLWAIVPRFAPARPEAAAGRRELGEHLSALGRFVWRAGGLEHWLEVARESCRNRLALRHPAILDLPPAEQAAALAELAGRPASLIAAALHQPAATPQSFTLALRTLRNLERTL